MCGNIMEGILGIQIEKEPGTEEHRHAKCSAQEHRRWGTLPLLVLALLMLTNLYLASCQYGSEIGTEGGGRGGGEGGGGELIA